MCICLFPLIVRYCISSCSHRSQEKQEKGLDRVLAKEGHMARIPEAEVERLKKEISVERLAEGRGIELTRHGVDLVGRCAFHDDRTPSLVITLGKNLWHCLGAC